MADKFHVGDTVEATWKTRYDYYPGVITDIQGDTYGVKFDDGDFKYKPAKAIRLVKKGRKTKRDTPGSASKEPPKKKRKVVQEEEVPEARPLKKNLATPKPKEPIYSLRKLAKPTTINLSSDDSPPPSPTKTPKAVKSTPPKKSPKVNLRPIYNVDDDDESVSQPSPKKRRAAAYRVGQKVDACWKTSYDYFPGTIKKVNGDGTFDIQFDDGDLKYGAPEGRIRKKVVEKKEKAPTRDQIKARAKKQITAAITN